MTAAKISISSIVASMVKRISDPRTSLYNKNLVFFFFCCCYSMHCRRRFNLTQVTGECASGSVRLVGGPNPSQGLVELCLFQTWRPVCASSFSYNEANVTCSALGYSGQSV